MIFSTNALSLLAAVSLFGGATFGMAVDIEGVVDDSKVSSASSAPFHVLYFFSFVCFAY
jgi:hypothetical protein